MKASSPSYLIFFLKILNMNYSSSYVLIAVKSMSASLFRVFTALELSKSFLFTAYFFFSKVSRRSLFSGSSGTMSTGSFLISLWFWMLMSSIPSGDISLDLSPDFFPWLSLLSEIQFSSTFWSIFSSYFSSSGNSWPSFLTTYSNI